MGATGSLCTRSWTTCVTIASEMCGWGGVEGEGGSPRPFVGFGAFGALLGFEKGRVELLFFLMHHDARPLYMIDLKEEGWLKSLSSGCFTQNGLLLSFDFVYKFSSSLF